MFTQTAAFYDALYAARGKDYRAEAVALAALIRARFPAAHMLLDVGCGTGAHLFEFERLGFSCRGVDADLKMVTLARARCESMTIEPADMLTLALEKRFDVVTCLFGTSGYARTPDRLRTTLARLAEHLGERGILLVEPFLSFEEYRAGHIDALFVDEPALKIARMSVSRQVGRLALLDFNYLVASPTGVERLFERHEVGLFSEGDYRSAFEQAGLGFEEWAEPAVGFGRRLYLGTRG
jgi:ubiquinone/menaquinone biosynthesis C-methylase UbiE